MYGLDPGFVLALENSAGPDAVDVSRFTRLKKLQLSGFIPHTESELCGQLGWRLGVPLSLRVLCMDGLDAAEYMV